MDMRTPAALAASYLRGVPGKQDFRFKTPFEDFGPCTKIYILCVILVQEGWLNQKGVGGNLAKKRL